MDPAKEIQIWLMHVSSKTTLTGNYPIHDGSIFSDLSKLNQLSLKELQTISWATAEETSGYRASALNESSTPNSRSRV